MLKCDKPLGPQLVTVHQTMWSEQARTGNAAARVWLRPGSWSSVSSYVEICIQARAECRAAQREHHQHGMQTDRTRNSVLVPVWGVQQS